MCVRVSLGSRLDGFRIVLSVRLQLQEEMKRQRWKEVNERMKENTERL